MEERGLTEKEAKKRLEQYGFNEIKDAFVLSPLKILIRQVRSNLVVYLLVAAMFISFFVGKNITTYTILAVIMLVVTTGFIQEYRAEKVINSLKSMLMPVSIVIRDGKESEVLSKEIVPGDLIVLRNGEKIPADCIIIGEKDLLINESVLTGESVEVKKQPSKNEKDYSDQNMVFMGCFIVNGKCLAKAVHTGMNTKFGKIARMISTAEKELPLQKKINKILKFMVVAAIVFSLATGISILLGRPFSENLFFDTLVLMIALSVSAFPEGFPAVLTTSLSVGAYKMAKQNAIVNRMSIIETLGETTVICSDKTGTITKGEMTVKKIFQNNSLVDVSGVGYNGDGDFFIDNKKLNLEKENVLNNLFKCAVLCNDSSIKRTGEDKIFHIIGSPVESSLLVMAAKANVYKEDLKFRRVDEVLFNSERKIMSVLCEIGKEKVVYSKGALEILLNKCRYIQRTDGVFTLTERERKRILEINLKMTSDCFRTLAFAYKHIQSFSKDSFEEELTFIGFAGIEDPPREEVKESIALCLKSGIQVKMITGDNKDTAVSISKRIGLKGEIMEGWELDKISEEELSKIVPQISIFARVKPEHKIKIVRALKMNGEIVTMTGDGVNDAPALKEAHIGVAMGKNGTDVSRSVADLTLKDDNFATIVYAIREGRTIFKNIRKFVSYQLSCNWAELIILFIGVLLSPMFGWQIPLLLAIQILFMNLVTDDLPAISLSVTPQSRDVMEEKPRKKKEILNKSLILWFSIAGMSMAAITLAVFCITFNLLGQEFIYARTTALVTLILLEIANAYNFLSFRHKVSFDSFGVNKYLSYASVISIAATLLIVYSPLNKVFETAPIGVVDWMVAVCASLLIVIIFNILKEINGKKEIFTLEHF
ncbi:cation transporter [Candidatus Woesearchaeota archaeon CG10_big_fil_rev_8_21_14_0_10_34_12]|nr:MAG: cation transporter [Candidatus Woesearchaeota archaeon CG10_big_fil_rev_8_21_14_0_10_34_12]